MKIEYELSETDILALMRFRLDQIHGLRNPVMRRQITYLVGFAMMAFGTWLFLHQVILLVAFLFLAAVFFLFYPLLFDWLIRRRVAVAYRDPSKRATLNTRTIHISSDGLQEQTEMGEIKIKWDVINEIALTSTHAFLSVQNVPSIIIPKESLRNDDFQAFVNICRENIEKSAAL
jgi:hypothetical protein